MLIPFFAAIGKNSPCKYGLKACENKHIIKSFSYFILFLYSIKSVLKGGTTWGYT
jgi:hypothetical protein